MSTKYYVDEDGVYLGGYGDGASVPEGSTEVDVPAHGLDIWVDGEWELYEEPVRDKRQEAYISELSREGTFEKTIGDMLDALVKHAYGDSTELDALVITINEIKARYPE